MKFNKLFVLMCLAGISVSSHAATVLWEGQSPIDITTANVQKVANNAVIQYHYSPEQVQLTNTWDSAGTVGKEWGTLKASPLSPALAFNSYVTVNGEKYVLAQFHFHTPSEHKVNNAPADMEVHFVHLKIHDNGVPYCIGEPQSLLVIGALIKTGARNDELDKIFSRTDLPVNKLAGSVSPITINFGKILPSNPSSYRYHGSLTAPTKVDCSSNTNATNNLNANPGFVNYNSAVADQLADLTREVDGSFPETVSWVVDTNPITMSAGQITKFRTLFDGIGNARPTVNLNGRKVLRMD
jgi:carbonic anhydrase